MIPPFSFGCQNERAWNLNFIYRATSASNTTTFPLGQV